MPRDATACDLRHEARAGPTEIKECTAEAFFCNLQHVELRRLTLLLNHALDLAIGQAFCRWLR